MYTKNGRMPCTALVVNKKIETDAEITSSYSSSAQSVCDVLSITSYKSITIHQSSHVIMLSDALTGFGAFNRVVTLYQR